MIPKDLMPAFRGTLLGGDYNLLLGSGVTLDSRNGHGELLRNSDALRRDLCKLTGARETTPLTRVYPLLTAQQVRRELTDRFSNCNAGPSVSNLPRFLWRRLFTFNIDDVIENLYAPSGNKQQLVPLNFDADFEPTPERTELQAVHLHGWVQKPLSGFVFSLNEYAQSMRALNPWMHLLSEILATEPFIIAGTSLNEPDLEYYLSHRNQATPRRGRGPSLLIEPNPDVVTKKDCERFGLTLVPEGFGAFMEWLHHEFPAPPNVSDLLVPDHANLFSAGLSPANTLRFFSDFELVPAGDRPLSLTPSPFLYGREPQWADLDQHVDIERQDNAIIQDLVSRSFAIKTQPRLILLSDDPGTGKTTTIRRVAHTLARSGRPVIAVHTLSRIDISNATTCLMHATAQILLVADGFADHAEQILELLAAPAVASNIVVLAAERSYRQEYLDLVLGDYRYTKSRLLDLSSNECRQLLERYRQFGLVGARLAVKTPRGFAKRLQGEPVAVSVCQILNDFRPLDAIVASLWDAADEDDRLAYLSVALAQHCYSAGLRYSILQAIMGSKKPVDRFFGVNVPLRLAINADQDEFVVAINAIIAERILRRTVRHDASILGRTFSGIASALVAHVNRRAIMRRSPEARLAGRLFDADKIVRPLLGAGADEFYSSAQKDWEWNSRYWEQRALLVAETDLGTSLQYARHAVAIEQHPFPLTTLGKILLKRMEVVPEERDVMFAEAFERLTTAIEQEVVHSRVTVHPFSTLLSGASRYLELGGSLSLRQKSALNGYSGEARYRFAGDQLIAAAQRRLDALMG